MSEYYWFKMLVRLVGLLLIGLGLPTLLAEVGTLIMMMVPGSPSYTSASARYGVVSLLPGVLAYGAQTAFGFYLLTKAQWVIHKVVSEIHGRCVVCGYDLKGVRGTSCPECNAPLRAANVEEAGAPPVGPARPE